MFGRLSSEELSSMRQLINKDNDELRASLETLWEDERTPEPMPLEAKARILTAIQRPTAPKRRYIGMKVACAVLLPLLLTWVPYFIYENLTAKHQSDLIVETDRGQKTHLTLPDGSKVWLNAQSTLKYPADFGRENRVVELTGEGYFEINKDTEHPFCVMTEKIDVLVLGTKFNVSAHKYDPNIHVSLIEGGVAINDKNSRTLTKLSPNQTIDIDKKDLNFTTIDEQTDLVALWHQNKCRFSNASAEEVFRQLGYWYGMNIKVENINTTYSYGFTVKNESIRELLGLIDLLTPIEYKINGEEVTVRYK